MNIPRKQDEIEDEIFNANACTFTRKNAYSTKPVSAHAACKQYKNASVNA